MLIKRVRYQDAADPFKISLLDTICAGFGALFLLFLVLVSMPQNESSQKLGSDKFFDLSITWDNPEIEYALVVKTPSNRSIYIYNESDINPITGKLQQSANREFKEIFVTGVSRYGDSFSREGTDLEAGKRQLRMRLTGPCSSQKWKFFLFEQNRRSNSWLDYDETETSRIQAQLYKAEQEQMPFVAKVYIPSAVDQVFQLFWSLDGDDEFDEDMDPGTLSIHKSPFNEECD